MKKSKTTDTSPRIITNKLGFKEVAKKPSREELQKFYAEQYYQAGHGLYAAAYDKDELQYIRNNNALKYEVVNSCFKKSRTGMSLLDIGCGEGFTMKYFRDKGWEVKGLDFSISGCRRHNPALQKYVVQGDIYRNIDALVAQRATFSCVTLVNVLEHVIDPVALIKKIRKLLKPTGLLVVDVPNDFSKLQRALLKAGKINKEFWVHYPDHLNYFTKGSLVRTHESTGFKTHKVVANFPIDYFLANPDTNYVKVRSRGKNCYRASVWLENFQCGISVEKTIRLYEALADLGAGRQICGYFIKA